ncbi:putative reverse transcriptase domain-containing protein [Tanacetum coccineum]
MEQKLENLAIMALDISGKKYLSWKLDAKTYLDAHDLGDTIQAGTFKDTSGYKKWQDMEKNKNDGDEKEKGVTANSCYRCGSFDHWAKHCCTPKHLVALYQKYIKNRENEVESNFVYDNRDDIPDDHKDQTDATYLDDDEFLTNA